MRVIARKVLSASGASIRSGRFSLERPWHTNRKRRRNGHQPMGGPEGQLRRQGAERERVRLMGVAGETIVGGRLRSSGDRLVKLIGTHSGIRSHRCIEQCHSYKGGDMEHPAQFARTRITAQRSAAIGLLGALEGTEEGDKLDVLLGGSSKSTSQSDGASRSNETFDLFDVLL